MGSMDAVFYILALVCFVCDALKVQTAVNLTALGLALLTLSLLV